MKIKVVITTIISMCFFIGIASARDEGNFSFKYEKEGTKRTLRAQATKVLTLHGGTYRHFVDNVEKEIKDPANNFEIKNFKAELDYVKGFYILKFSVDLFPTTKQKANRLVALRGTIWQGEDALEGVLEKNKEKISSWKIKMAFEYTKMEISYEKSSTAIDTPNGPIFYQGILAKGRLK